MGPASSAWERRQARSVVRERAMASGAKGQAHLSSDPPLSRRLPSTGRRALPMPPRPLGNPPPPRRPPGTRLRDAHASARERLDGVRVPGGVQPPRHARPPPMLFVVARGDDGPGEPHASSPPAVHLPPLTLHHMHSTPRLRPLLPHPRRFQSLRRRWSAAHRSTRPRLRNAHKEPTTRAYHSGEKNARRAVKSPSLGTACRVPSPPSPPSPSQPRPPATPLQGAASPTFQLARAASSGSSPGQRQPIRATRPVAH